MQFDPMTGEPIEEQQNEENVQFDPMTGEPISQTAQEEQPTGGFDPMTESQSARQLRKNSPQAALIP